MSRKQSTVAKPYCKVCHDAGKSESEYSSHYVRTSLDPNAKISCPTLLAVECKYCFRPGHTVKYCGILKKNEKNKRTEDFKNQEQKTEKKTEKKANPKNAFNTLYESSDEEEEEKENPEFPQLNSTKMKTVKPLQTQTQSFASIASNGHAKMVAKEHEQEKETMIRKKVEEISQKQSYQVVPEPRLTGRLNWADYDTDSDDSDNESF